MSRRFRFWPEADVWESLQLRVATPCSTAQIAA